MFATLILFRLGETEAGPLITLALGTFAAPHFPLRVWRRNGGCATKRGSRGGSNWLN
jgi:hypothetical protein